MLVSLSEVDNSKTNTQQGTRDKPKRVGDTVDALMPDALGDVNTYCCWWVI